MKHTCLRNIPETATSAAANGERLCTWFGGGGFTFSVLYEISHFLHGRNIPFAIFAVKRLKKNNCTTKELCCKKV